ncbi:MAG: hypothetical protein IT454_04930 [Planctomycetes bacterium]|nr:hypothetical protein [Planctomycetota bacterium]
MSVLILALAPFAAPFQQALPSGAPITAEIVDAGVFNWSTKSWVPPHRAAQLRAASTTVYNNTCTYTGGNSFDAIGTCVTYFDEGRIPSSTDPAAPAAATDDNRIDSFQIAYCTRTANGLIDVKVGFYANWGGCMQGLGGTPWSGSLQANATAYFDFGAAAGFPLPGDPVPGGGYQCNKVTIALGNAAFCMPSDGDGVFDNVAASDTFAWSLESNTPANPPTEGISLIRAGEPSLSQPGGCTYNIPCGSDPTPWGAFGPAPQSCGHGLGTQDRWWQNIDGVPWGQAGGTCATVPGGGGGCYWFGGNPGNPFASYWLVLGSAGSCAGCTGSPTTYCTAGTSSGGCSATMGMTGQPNVSSTGPCNITVSNVEPQKAGLIFYGLTQVAVQWGPSTSFLCVKSPTQRTLSQNSGGTPGQCNGTFSTNINQFFAANPTAIGQPLFAGEVLHFQAWYRDPPSPKTTNLSDALSITMCP